MLQWNDGSWDHRAYWGANNLGYGVDATVGRHYMGALPPTGQWVQLKVPASAVGLEGRTLNGMAFTLYGGRAVWDAAGRLNQQNGSGTTVSVVATADASRLNSTPGVFTFTRTGDTSAALPVPFSLGGTANSGTDYQAVPGGASPSITFAAGSSSATVLIQPVITTNIVGQQNVMLTLAANNSYTVGSPSAANMTLIGNTVRSTLKIAAAAPSLSWPTTPGKSYRVCYKNSLSDPTWVPATGTIVAAGNGMSWSDSTASGKSQRFYLVNQMN
jgi:hypothetical protein